MKTSIITVFFCFLMVFSWGQDRQVSLASLDQLAHMSPARPGFRTFDNDGINYEGTPFLFDDWRVGRVQLKGQEEFSEELGIILDLQDDRIYIQLNAEFVSQFPVDKIGMVELYNDQDTLRYRPYNLGKSYGIGPNGFRFYQVLHDGDYVVLHGEKKYLRKEDYVEKLGMVTRPNKFMSLHSYWVSNGKIFKKAKKKSKSLKEILPPKDARKVKKIIKSNDLNIKKDQDFGEFFRLLEQEKYIQP